MAFILIMAAAAAAAQPAVPFDISVIATEHARAGDRLDVAFEELAADRTLDAVVKLEALPRELRSEPVALINLGTAYARLGRRAEAETMFVKAIASRERYDLELADGSWMNSRNAARMALSLLNEGEALALR